MVREEKEKQHAKIAAKIANLRGLRLAKEQADKKAAGAATTTHERMAGKGRKE